jgi:thiosulfate/3-mercaptopyruvate sulfurtransferase
VSTEPVVVAPTSLDTRLDPGVFATAGDILASIDAGGTTIIDTRGDLEWMQGTIPTAQHLEWIHHLTPDGTLRSRDELRGLYDELGLAPEDEAITFCASGYRAAHTWLVLRWLGYDSVRNYAPSWGEWGRRADLPVEATR